MVLLPVVGRELRVASRGRAIYRVRFWAVLVMLGLFLWFIKTTGVDRNSSRFGEEVMSVLLVPAFIFSLFIGVLATADCVSSEKRQGTLGLLFLTDLKGYDVICGKLAANSLNAIYALLAILPVMGLPVMLGGVTFTQFVKLAVTLFSLMFLSLAAGIFVSTCSRNERKAMFFTVLLLLAITFGPVALVAWYDGSVHSIPEKDIWKFLLFSPAFGIPETLSPAASFPASSFWLSILWEWLVAVALIVRASVRVPHSWEETGAKKKPSGDAQKKAVLTKSRATQGRAWLERNPFLWLALQGDEAGPGRVWFFVVAILVIWQIAVLKFGMRMMMAAEMATLTGLLLHLPLKIWIAAEASRRFSEDRSNNTFEFILSTPLKEAQIIQGQWLALMKQFAAPIAVVLVWELSLTIFSSSHHVWDAAGPMDYWPKMARLVADSFALAWAGMWLGLKCKGRIRAILASLTLVLIVPSVVTLMILSLGSIFRVLPNAFPSYAGNAYGWKEFQMLATLVPGLLMDLVVVIWAASRLPKNFRQFAIRR